MSVAAISGSNNDYQYQQASSASQSNNGGGSQEVASSGGAGESGASGSAGSAGATGSSDATGSTSGVDDDGIVKAQVSTPKEEEVEEASDPNELFAGKSTVKGDVDYFDGASVITDADTAVDIAKIMVENQSSNMSPAKLAGLLSEKGYNVEVVKVGNREAVKFENGDFFYDSDGDGYLGTKDQNFQSALSMVEQNYGVDLSELKNSKYTAYHKYSEIGKGKDIDIENATVLKAFAAGEGRDAAFEALEAAKHKKDDAGDATLTDADAAAAAEKEKEKKANEETKAILEELDEDLEAAGYRGDKSAYDMWMDGELSEVLIQYGIDEPSLPETNKAISDSMALFGAALSVAAAIESAAEI